MTRLLSLFTTAAFVATLFLLPVTSSSPEVGRNRSSTWQFRHDRVRGVDASSCQKLLSPYDRFYRPIISISGHLFVTGSRSESFECEAISSPRQQIVVSSRNCHLHTIALSSHYFYFRSPARRRKSVGIVLVREELVTVGFAGSTDRRASWRLSVDPRIAAAADNSRCPCVCPSKDRED